MRLVCPITFLALEPGPVPVIAELNAAIARGEIRTLGGGSRRTPLDGVLVRADRAVGYPIERGIPVMLPDEALDLSGHALPLPRS